MRLTSICLCALVVLCLARRTHVALTPQATEDTGRVPSFDELSLNDELEQQQPKLKTVNLSSSAIASDDGLTWHIGVCSLDNNDRLTGMCISACKSQLDTLYCPKGSPGYPAGFVCGRIKATRRVCYFRAP